MEVVMKDLMGSLRQRREIEEFSVASIASAKQNVIQALLDGPEFLAAMEGTVVRLGDGDEFIPLAALPTVLRREYLMKFRSTACLINPKLLLAPLGDWQAWVNSMVPMWRQRT
jgi:hypothetical protein